MFFYIDLFVWMWYIFLILLVEVVILFEVYGLVCGVIRVVFGYRGFGRGRLRT